MIDNDLTFLASSNAPHCTQRLDKYVVGYYTMQFMEQGGVDLYYDDRMQRMEGAWFWPAYPGPRLRFHAAPGYGEWHHRHIAFQGPRVQRWIAAGIWPQEAQPAPAVTPRNWPVFFDELIVQSRRTDRWGRLRAINLLEQMLVELAEARASAVSSANRLPWLEPLLEQLTADGNFAPDYSHLAAALGIGVSTLRRHFRDATGVSLHTYVLQARIAKARALIGETDLPLKVVAERLGYDNVYFFSRQFKQHIGVSPGIYRRSRQA